MRLKLRTLWRLRPRILTLILLLLLAAPIVPANFVAEPGEFKALANGTAGLQYMSYGWPLCWHRYAFSFWVVGGGRIIDWQWSAGRLAANIAAWLVLLALPALMCEWALRRYRPRLRWSLRTMLIAVGLLATLCAAIASAHRRADLHDSIIATIKARPFGRVWINDWWPDWFELVEADRYCRHIIAAEFTSDDGTKDHSEEDKALFQRLAKLSHLQELSLDGVGSLDPGMAEAMAQMRQLRTLTIKCYSDDDDQQRAREWLKLAGRLSHIEHLRLEGTIPTDSLAGLEGLNHLKSLALDITSRWEQLLLVTRLPVLPRLELLDLPAVKIGEQDLIHIGTLPCLKFLRLTDSVLNAATLSKLATCSSLEELEISTYHLSPEGLKSLVALPKLRVLHIKAPGIISREYVELALADGHKTLVLQDQRAGYIAALSALRRSKPGIIIDDAEIDLPWRHTFPAESNLPIHRPTWLPTAEWWPASNRAQFKASAPKFGILTPSDPLSDRSEWDADGAVGHE